MRVGGDAIDVVSRQGGNSLIAEDRDSYGSNCEPNATDPWLARLGTRFRGSRAVGAAFKRATRGTNRRVVSTAERSHRPSQRAATRVGGDAIDVVSRQEGNSLLAEDRDSYGSNCEPNATAPRSARLGMRFRGSRTAARCTRRRATHGYFIDRSAVADSPAHDPRLLRITAVRWCLHSARFIPEGSPQACGELLYRPLRGRGQRRVTSRPGRDPWLLSASFIPTGTPEAWWKYP